MNSTPTFARIVPPRGIPLGIGRQEDLRGDVRDGVHLLRAVLRSRRREGVLHLRGDEGRRAVRLVQGSVRARGRRVRERGVIAFVVARSFTDARYKV
eukprot:30202-Pelagococcus_subviridis.AAC.5